MERHTRQRQAVVDALVHSGQALSPQDLLVHAKLAVPSLNLSTVYRQIKGLQQTGQIVRVELPGQPARFEITAREAAADARPPQRTQPQTTAAKSPAAARRLATAQAGGATHRHAANRKGNANDAAHASHHHNHHHHFHCVQCDRVYPIHACPGSMNDLAPPGFEVQHHDLTLRGRCAGCSAGKTA
jgi:Fur family transcriptional regulator, ferric uptake regulator